MTTTPPLYVYFSCFVSLNVNFVVCSSPCHARPGPPVFGSPFSLFLKKKVLKERLRIWKERNGIVDDGGEGNDDNDDDKRRGSARATSDDCDDRRPSTKRLRTDGASHNDALTTTSFTYGEWMTTTRTTTALIVKNFVRPDEDDLLDDDEHANEFLKFRMPGHLDHMRPKLQTRAR